MNTKVKVDNKIVCINPLLIFQKICVSIKNRSDMKEKLYFELALFPLSLFNEGGMPKIQKSVFCSLFNNIPARPSEKENILHVIDGGCLLQHFLWGSVTKVSDIVQGDVSYVQRYYVRNSLLSLMNMMYLERKVVNECGEKTKIVLLQK